MDFLTQAGGVKIFASAGIVRTIFITSGLAYILFDENSNLQPVIVIAQIYNIFSFFSTLNLIYGVKNARLAISSTAKH